MANMQAQFKTDGARHWDVVLAAMTGRGLLLGSYDDEHRANLMTVGWGSLGVLWGHPVWTIMVRPTRYTWQCIEHSGCFSVNVPGPALSDVCLMCGTTSRLSPEKLSEAGLTFAPGSEVSAPVVAECPLVYECRVIHRTDVLPERLSEELISGAYMDDEYHRIYHGQIVAVRRDPDALERLL